MIFQGPKTHFQAIFKTDWKIKRFSRQHWNSSTFQGLWEPCKQVFSRHYVVGEDRGGLESLDPLPVSHPTPPNFFLSTSSPFFNLPGISLWGNTPSKLRFFTLAPARLTPAHISPKASLPRPPTPGSWSPCPPPQCWPSPADWYIFSGMFLRWMP